MSKYIITVCGLGKTGRTIVSLLLQQRINDFTINILDPSNDIEGSYLDLSHASMLTSHTVLLNDNDCFSKSDFVFHTAGASVTKGQDRNSIVNESIDITKRVFSNVEFSGSPYIIVVSNPVDVLTTYLYKKIKVSSKQIVSTGTLLDTARLQFFSNNDEDFVIGEHGDKMLLWLREATNSIDLHKKTINAAAQIKKTQGATFFGVAQCCIKILDIILNNNTSEVIPISIYNSEEEVFYSTLAKFNNQVFKSIDFDLPENLRKGFIESIKSIQNTYSSVI